MALSGFSYFLKGESLPLLTPFYPTSGYRQFSLTLPLGYPHCHATGLILFSIPSEVSEALSLGAGPLPTSQAPEGCPVTEQGELGSRQGAGRKPNGLISETLL